MHSLTLTISGDLKITLLSKEFEPDVAHGETSLTKDELGFRGSSFEVQFACRYKVGNFQL